ncbi:MAG: NAD-dependent epimerase/dehydratase family protein, partial [Gammaproteobacteria bacterium]|nr:NAD-dependent epimerase/dehydratase family protein [Gammaproteobacteria bacterium]
QPSALVLCHEPTRTHMRGLPNRSLPTLSACVNANLEAAQVVAPQARFVGVSVNTQHLSKADARTVLNAAEKELGLPAIDPARDGVDRIIDELL